MRPAPHFFVLINRNYAGQTQWGNYSGANVGQLQWGKCGANTVGQMWGKYSGANVGGVGLVWVNFEVILMLKLFLFTY